MLLLLWLLTPAAQASPASKAQDLAERAHEKLGTDPLGAFRLAAKALERDPLNIEAHLVRGSAGMSLAPRLPDPDVARLALTLAHSDLTFVAEHSQDPFEVGMARGLLNLGEERAVMPEPITECSATATRAFDIAEMAFAKRDYEAARVAYEVAVTECPANPTWWAYYGDAWFDVGEYAIAREKYNRALQIEPCYWSALRFRGDAYMHEGNVVAGMTDTLTALACNPGYEIGWGYLASTVAVAGAELIREPVVRPVAGAGPVPAVWIAYEEARHASIAVDALGKERDGVQAGLRTIRSLTPTTTSPLWRALDAAEADGTLDDAIYIWFFNKDLLPGFLAYREEHLPQLVEYIRTHLVAFPPTTPE